MVGKRCYDRNLTSKVEQGGTSQKQSYKALLLSFIEGDGMDSGLEK